MSISPPDDSDGTPATPTATTGTGPTTPTSPSLSQESSGQRADRTVEPQNRKPVTVRTLNAMAARGEPFACLTAYDATMARWLARAGVPVLLVGDSAAQMVLGYERTIDMPLDISLVLTAAVKRGAPRTLVMGDMPFPTYHASDEQAITNAARFLTEGMADVIKIEADASFAPLVAKLTRAGIPICAHVGCRPQTVALTGGYRIAGRTASNAMKVIEDAIALEQAGAVLLLVEAVPDEVTQAIVAKTSVPVIGIGAGTDCHGQVLVIQDLLGFTENPPRFAQAVADLGHQVQDAASEWIKRVQDGTIGGRRYVMHEGEADRLRAMQAHEAQDKLSENISPADVNTPEGKHNPMGRTQ